jgi:hypothetical protein
MKAFLNLCANIIKAFLYKKPERYSKERMKVLSSFYIGNGEFYVKIDNFVGQVIQVYCRIIDSPFDYREDYVVLAINSKTSRNIPTSWKEMFPEKNYYDDGYSTMYNQYIDLEVAALATNEVRRLMNELKAMFPRYLANDNLNRITPYQMVTEYQRSLNRSLH